MLTCDAARELYQKGAQGKPIIDYHCHLSPEQIASNIQFKDITQLWLSEDHYKWRAMRANGIPEEFVTGNKCSSWEKFSSIVFQGKFKAIHEPSEFVSDFVAVEVLSRCAQSDGELIC